MTTPLSRLLFCIFAALAPLAFASAEPSVASPAATMSGGPSTHIQGLVLDADEMDRDSEANTVELKGHVQIVSEDRHIQADHAKIELRSKRVDLSGHVRLTSTKATIGGDRIILDDETGTGVIYNGFVQSGNVSFEGSVIEKTAADEFFVVNANYTACTNCPATWSFRGTSIRAELGGYAYIKNSILNVGTVPILWLPYLVVPLKSDRQSGLLSPGFEQSQDGGLAVSESYFWAISRSTDATFTLKNYELRGLKGLLNYRYVLDEHSSGELDTGGVRDQAFKDIPRLNDWRNSTEKGNAVNRWFIKYAHYQELPDGWSQRAIINDASDLQYPKDFPTETLNHGDSAMETRVSMTKNTRDTHFSVDSSYYVNLLHGDPLSSNEDAVHRIPEIRYSRISKELGSSGFYYSFNADFANFTRSGQAFDHLTYPAGYTDPSTGKPVRTISVDSSCADPTKYGSDPNCRRLDSGDFNPNSDLIRTGQRLDFQPTIMFPMNLWDSLDIVPKASFRETDYHFPIPHVEDNSRRYIRGEVASRMRFSQVYGDLVSPKGTRYKHEIRPEVTYTALPWFSHAKHPFFGNVDDTESQAFQSQGIADSDLASPNGLQFDYEDRIYDSNLVTYSVVNTFTEKKWVNEMPVYKQIALFKLSQSYDGWKASHGRDQPQSDIAALIDLRFDRFQTYSLFNYYPAQKVTNSSAHMRVNDTAGKFLQFGVVNQYKIVGDNPVDPSTRLEDYTVGGGVVAKAVNLMGKITYDNNAHHDKSWTYIAQFKPPGDCWIITLINDHITGGDTSIKLNFEFTFDGLPKAPLPPETLDAYGF